MVQALKLSQDKKLFGISTLAAYVLICWLLTAKYRLLSVALNRQFVRVKFAESSVTNSCPATSMKRLVKRVRKRIVIGRKTLIKNTVTAILILVPPILEVHRPIIVPIVAT